MSRRPDKIPESPNEGQEGSQELGDIEVLPPNQSGHMQGNELSSAISAIASDNHGRMGGLIGAEMISAASKFLGREREELIENISKKERELNELRGKIKSLEVERAEIKSDLRECRSMGKNSTLLVQIGSVIFAVGISIMDKDNPLPSAIILVVGLVCTGVGWFNLWSKRGEG